MLGDIRAYDIPAIVGQNDHHVEQPKRRGRDKERIDCSDAGGLIPQEAAPGRGRRTCVPRLRTVYLATVAWLISMPTLSSSPWIRGAPQSGLALLICRIRSRISRSTDGRPDLERP